MSMCGEERRIFLIVVIMVIWLSIGGIGIVLIEPKEQLPKGRLILPSHMITYANAWNSYLPIKYNAYMASGWAETYATQEYYSKLIVSSRAYLNGGCERIKETSQPIGITKIIATGVDCKKLSQCEHLTLLNQTKVACFYLDLDLEIEIAGEDRMKKEYELIHNMEILREITDAETLPFEMGAKNEANFL